MGLGTNIKVHRLEKGLTQEKLAQKMNTTKAAISRYEKDQRQPRLDIILRICEVLDVSISDLIGR